MIEPRRGRRRGWYRSLLAGLVAAAAAAGCGSTSHPVTQAAPTTTVAPTTATAAATTTTTLPSTTTTTVATTTTTVATTTTTTGPPAFSATAAAVTAAQLGGTWHAGCPVSPDQLQLLTMTYWGFDGQAHTGTMVVNTSVVPSVEKVFATLYGERFPIQEMIPEAAYGGDDNAAAAADDTSGFNCRYAVAPGPPQWSVHAYGEAIDVNDVQNPYIDGSTIIPPSGAAYEDRSDVRPGMATVGGQLVEAFAAVGWQWGGRWSPGTDYQHFSLTGG